MKKWPQGCGERVGEARVGTEAEQGEESSMVCSHRSLSAL